MNAHVVLDASGYMLGIANNSFGINGVESAELPVPDDFREEWMSCYKRVGDEWAFDEYKRETYIAKEYMAEIRAERNRRLAASDYVMLPDYPMSESKRAEWAAYRQELRDIPMQEGFPLDVIWPVKPD